MINRIFYNIREGFKGLWRNRPMAIASISSVSASIFTLGIVIMLVLNINNFTLMTQNRFDKIQVFMQDEVGNQELFSFKSRLENIDGVRLVEFESKDDAMRKLKERWGEDSYLLEGIENPLQNSYIVHLERIEYADVVVNEIKKSSGIDDIKYYRDLIEKLIKISNTIRNGGLIVIILLSTVSLFVISNTIKLALYSRKREINIMKYVGATNWFIRGPFLVEGFLLGGMGALVSFGITTLSYSYLYDRVSASSYSIFTTYIMPLSQMRGSLAIIFFTIGCGIGILGSLISLRRYLEV